MSLPTNFTVIGAGSASFGENTLSAILRSKKLKGSRLALVDRNAETLDIVRRRGVYTSLSKCSSSQRH